jgi:hypothetical protein
MIPLKVTFLNCVTGTRRTMFGQATITIDSSRGQYVSLESQMVVRRIMASAGAKDWQAVQCVVIPDDLILGNLVWISKLAVMRKNILAARRESFRHQSPGKAEKVDPSDSSISLSAAPKDTPALVKGDPHHPTLRP